MSSPKYLHQLGNVTLLATALLSSNCSSPERSSENHKEPQVTSATATKNSAPTPTAAASLDTAEVKEQDLSHEKNGKVIYIPDWHKSKNYPFTKEIQKEIFQTVKSIIAQLPQNSSVPLVIESWREGESVDQHRSRFDETSTLLPLYSEKNDALRMKIGDQLINNDTSAAAFILPGVYRTEITPVGTITEDIVAQTNELVRLDKIMVQILDHEKPFCQTESGKKALKEVKTAFANDLDEPEDACYCALRNIDDEVHQLLKDRLSTVPVREAKKAVNAIKESSNKNRLVILISGYNHWEKAREELKKSQVSYTMLMPRTMSKNLSQLENKNIFRDRAPDIQNRCSKFSASLISSLADSIVKK